MWTTISSQYCVTDLTSHWQRTALRTVEYGPLGSWQPLDLLQAVRNPDDFARRDRLARELVALAKSGHAGADQLLLMAMLPRVVHLTRTCRGLRHLPVRDAQAIALGAMWEAIRTHPETQTSAVLHRLGMDALRIVTRTHTSHVASPELSTDPSTMTRLREAEEPTPEAVDELAEVLRWGLESNAITNEDVRVIAAVDLGARGDRERLADELGVSAPSIVRRAHRIRARLKQAVSAEVERLGSW